MSEQTIRWGILGPGSIARRFAGQLPHSRTGSLQAVASRNPQQAADFAAEFGAPKSYGSYAELLADPEIDAVYISTVHINHHQLTVLAAEAGKHVLCEKPIAVNHAWAMAAVEAARRNGVFLAEAYMYRFHPQTRKLAELISQGAIGKVSVIEAAFSYNAAYNPDSRQLSADLAGGGILDVGGYPVSMARMVAGAAMGVPYIDPDTLTAVGRVGDTGADEWTVATLHFPGDITARVTTGVRMQDENAARIFGSEGHITVPSPWVIQPEEPGRLIINRLGQPAEEILTDAAYQYALEADAVGVRDSSLEAPEISWADSLGNARVLDQWRDAIGLRYPFEEDSVNIPTVSGAPLQVRADTAMPYGEIPGIDTRMSRLVMGCDNQTTLSHASAMFDDFFERGGTTFDTGYIYGRGRMETLLGRWIANRGVRDDVVVIGKGAHTPHCDPESITRQLDETLGRLGADHLDLYLMHRDNPDYGVNEFIDVLDEQQRAGKIRAFGGSNWTIDRFTEANRYAREAGKHPMVALSNHFGLARAHDVPWAGCEHVTDPASRAWLAQTGVPLLPWSSQARGFFAPGRAHPDNHSDPELERCYYSDENFERLRRATILAEKLGVLATAVALAYVLHQPFPTFALIGPRSLAETRTSTEALKISLTREQCDWLDLTTDAQP